MFIKHGGETLKDLFAPNAFRMMNKKEVFRLIFHLTYVVYFLHYELIQSWDDYVKL